MAEDSSEIVREMSESVAATNLKVLSDGPAFFTNQLYANSVAQQQSMSQLNNAIIGKVAESIIATSPSEGGADIAALMQIVKAGALTPRETGIPTA